LGDLGIGGPGIGPVDKAPGPWPDAVMRVLLLGSTGTIGRAAARALLADGHHVIAPLRGAAPPGVDGRAADVTAPGEVGRALGGDRIDAVISCLASRTGAAAEAWAVDHAATVAAFQAARDAGAERAVLLSAICVQKPHLPFQHAKLAAEAALQAMGMTWSVVRPTAYFKSLSGQVARVARGQPFLVFGDGRGTACTPISDDDLGRFLADCLTQDDRANRVLPIGGPGPALTPREMGQILFDLTGRPARFRQVSPGVLTAAAGLLGALGRVVPSLRARADLARIGHYYATESMLVWDGQRYRADLTPAWGTQTLRDHYARVLAGERSADLGAHALFDR
jgi:divinyl chlorophyllide a 8-vinyl-reductase